MFTVFLAFHHWTEPKLCRNLLLLLTNGLYVAMRVKTKWVTFLSFLSFRMDCYFRGGSDHSGSRLPRPHEAPARTFPDFARKDSHFLPMCVLLHWPRAVWYCARSADRRAAPGHRWRTDRAFNSAFWGLHFSNLIFYCFLFRLYI